VDGTIEEPVALAKHLAGSYHFGRLCLHGVHSSCAKKTFAFISGGRRGGKHFGISFILHFYIADL
jgi:hypothetical protein